jgi:hypothetical protein
MSRRCVIYPASSCTQPSPCSTPHHTPPHSLPHCLPTSSHRAGQHYTVRPHPSVANHRLHASGPCSPAKSCLPCVRSYRHTDFLYHVSLIGPGTSAACSASGLAVVYVYTVQVDLRCAVTELSVAVVRGRYSSTVTARLEKTSWLEVADESGDEDSVGFEEALSAQPCW